MLRTTLGVLARNSTESKLGNSSFSLEFVRWRRKPRWVPVAKSKMFRVPERKQQTPEEKLELLRLHNNYRTQMRSVRLHFREEAQRVRETSTADHIVLTPEQEEQEFQLCIQENDMWNEKISAERNQRLEKESQERREYIKERLELAKEREEERIRKIEEIVRREKELSKTFITRENLDVAIETALANPVDYNFSIDLKGNMYTGRMTLPGGSGGTSDMKDQQPELLEASN